MILSEISLKINWVKWRKYIKEELDSNNFSIPSEIHLYKSKSYGTLFWPHAQGRAQRNGIIQRGGIEKKG